MHIFWQPGFTLLHARVCDFLAETHHVGLLPLLPLLAVNQHLRKLVTDRLIKAYSSTKWTGWCEDGMTPKIEGGEFVRIFINTLNPYDDGPFEENDPRMALSERFLKQIRSRPVDMIFESFDASSRVCRFKPPVCTAMLEFDLLVDEDRMPWPEFDYHAFNVLPTGWFRHGRPDEPAVAGLVIAADPTAFLPLRASFSAIIPDELDGSETVENKVINLGWKISYWAARLDSDPDTGIPLHELYEEVELTELVPASCHPKALEIPLLDLFVPRDRTKDRPWYDMGDESF